jgi:hypothetical protein
MRPFSHLRLPFVLLLLLLGAEVVRAQQVREQPPLYPGTFTQVPGVFVTPIAGAPFTATVMIVSKQPTADGSMDTRMTQVLIARDSRGRIRNERHALVPEAFHGMPPLIGVHVFDPATLVSYMFNPATMIAQERIVPLPPPHRANPSATDLGYQTLNGMQARGSRITRVIPAEMSGTGKLVTITDEVWYSEDLHMNLLEEHTDPRGGKQSLAILSIERKEPSASLFEVPAGYKIVDLTPPAAAQR